MNPSNSSARLTIPDLGAEKAELLSYRDRVFKDGFWNTLRVRRLEEKVRNLLYYRDRQWIVLDQATLMNGSRGFIFRDLQKNPDRDFPRPVTNYIKPAVNVELSALGRRQLTANVVPRSRDPRAEAAAKISKEVLEDRLNKLNWADLREHFTFLVIVTGMGILKSWWDEPITDSGFYDTGEALMCLSCGAMLATPQVEKKAAEEAQAKHLDKAEEVDDEKISHSVCPACEEPQEMAQMDLDEDLAQQSDFYGRPMGQILPKGQTSIEIVSPFDFFPENVGVDVDWNTMKIWRQATPRSLDWILTRWPELEGKVQAEESRELLKNHPVLGDWDITGRYDAKLDADLFSSHAMVYEVYAEKSLRFPNGRAFIIIGDEVAFDGELYRQEGQVSVATVRYAGANWEALHREIWGIALVDSLISPQNQINMLDALELDALGRTGSPNLLVPEGAGFDGAEYFDENLGKIVRYRIDPLNPAAKPEILGGASMPPSAKEMRNQKVADMQILAGPQPIEQGEAPKNITTTSGLQLLGENAEKRRAHRERALISAFEKIWQHQLEMLWGLRVDPDTYESMTDDGSWEVREYTRASLMGQTKIEIEKQAEIDKSLYQREAVREAMADQLYLIDSIQAKKRILELRGLPTDVNEDINYQIENVKKQWVDFAERGEVPVIDPTIDNFQVRYEGFATFLLSPEGQKISQQAGWNQILKQISGWEIRVQQAEAVDQQARAMYGTTDPSKTGPMYEQFQMQYQQSMGAWQQEQASGQQMAQEGMAPMSTPPPQEPVPPIFLPGDRADHIYGIWQQMLGEAMGGMLGGPPQLGGSAPLGPAQMAKQSDTYLKFRAVVEAYRLLAQEKMAKDLMMQQPQPPSGPNDVGQAMNNSPSQPPTPV